jgi:hypothetical protein
MVPMDTEQDRPVTHPGYLEGPARETPRAAPDSLLFFLSLPVLLFYLLVLYHEVRWQRFSRF